MCKNRTTLVGYNLHTRTAELDGDINSFIVTHATHLKSFARCFIKLFTVKGERELFFSLVASIGGCLWLMMRRSSSRPQQLREQLLQAVDEQNNVSESNDYGVFIGSAFSG